MALFSVFNKFKICDVTLTNTLLTTSSRLHKFILAEKKERLQQIVYETRPDKLEIGLFKPSLNYTFTQTPVQKQTPVQNISLYNPMLKRFDIIEKTYDPFQEIYKSKNKTYSIGQKEQHCDTLQLYNFAQNLLRKNSIDCQLYVLMPLSKLYIDQARFLNIKNISINTALSETFLQKYTNRPLKSTKHLLTSLFAKDDRRFKNVKLYVACLSYCPFEGEKQIKHIIADILYYNTLPGITEICLTDTFGSLRAKDFLNIVEGLTKHMDMRKLSVRLIMRHSCDIEVNTQQESNIAKIIQFCIQNNIYQFDVVSDDEENDNAGGCKILNSDKLYDYADDYTDDYAELAYYA